MNEDEFKRAIANATRRSDRHSVSIYVSEGVFDAFKRACGEKISPSAVLENYMREFVDATLKFNKK